MNRDRLWLLVILTTLIYSNDLTMGKQAQVNMCLYRQILGITGVNCTDKSETSKEDKKPVFKLKEEVIARDEPTPQANQNEDGKNKLNTCSSSAAMIICTKDLANECAESGQVCTLSDRSRCCQNILRGIPVSYINAKAGECPQPIGISGNPEISQNGCWLDSNCPGVQKCCLEPNPISGASTRLCRDPLGISKKLGGSVCNLPLAVGTCTAPVTRYYYDSSSGQCKTFQFSGCNGNANNFQSLASCQATCSYLGIQGTPLCPADANANINCLFAHSDACNSDNDCLGRENNVQPSCCMTKCGYRICYLY